MFTAYSVAGKRLSIALALAVLAGWTVLVQAHCDTVSGPVVQDARLAFQKGDVTPVLKWVKPEFEGQIKEAFKKTMEVRSKGPEAKELADQWFFETLVRIHREGEGAPYTGLKPASAEVEPGILAADKALETGSPDALINSTAGMVSHGIRERLTKALEAKKHKDESVEAGREYVEAYVLFIHYVERLQADATTAPSHKVEAEGASGDHSHGSAKGKGEQP